MDRRSNDRTSVERANAKIGQRGEVYHLLVEANKCVRCRERELMCYVRNDTRACYECGVYGSRQHCSFTDIEQGIPRGRNRERANVEEKLAERETALESVDETLEEVVAGVSHTRDALDVLFEKFDEIHEEMRWGFRGMNERLTEVEGRIGELSDRVEKWMEKDGFSGIEEGGEESEEN